MMNLGGVRIFVDSLQAALTFYRALLGAPIAQDDVAGFVVFDAGGVNVVIELVTAESPGEEQALVGRFTGVSFEVEDIGAAHARLSDSGVLFIGEPELQGWGGWLATLRDPAGNTLQLVQYEG